jgi:tripartite-type tricarboxylate transporter receptor subunit TctC
MILSRWILAAAVLCTVGVADGRAEFPERTVTFVIGQAPGGSTEAAARFLADGLSKKWGKPVVLQNKPGADGAIAATLVSRAKPDGYTLQYINALHTITPHTQKVDYDPVKSFTPITKIMAQPSVLVINPKFTDFKTLQDLIDYAKKNPGKLNHGSAGTASPAAISMGLLNKKAGIDVVDVTFTGGGPALVALLSGEVQLAFAAIGGAMGHVEAGTLRPLAVTSRTRVPQFPNVPPVMEAAKVGDFNYGTWNGVLAPAGLPPDILKKIHADILEVMNQPDVQAGLRKIGMYPETSPTPQDFTKFLNEELTVWDQVQSGSSKR